MSMILMVKAMQTKVGNPLRKLVLIKLADNANDLGECWPSYQHIADQCEISRRSVINHINKLEEMGLLKKKYRKGAGKPNSSNVFILQLDGALAAPHGAGAAPASAGAAPPHGAGAAPRTSHSLEPIKEPSSAKGIAQAENTAFEIYWAAGMTKQNKKRALVLFNNICKKQKLCPHEFANKLAYDVRRRLAAGQFGFDRMHPTTYLNNERWKDDVVAGADSAVENKTGIDFNSTGWMRS